MLFWNSAHVCSLWGVGWGKDFLLTERPSSGSNGVDKSQARVAGPGQQNTTLLLSCDRPAGGERAPGPPHVALFIVQSNTGGIHAHTSVRRTVGLSKYMPEDKGSRYSLLPGTIKGMPGHTPHPSPARPGHSSS
jgi:hypothetical protein